MGKPIGDALNRPTVEHLVSEAKRAREAVRNAVAVTNLRLGELDPDLREEARRERAGIIRAQAREKAAEALERARRVKATAEAFQAMGGRRASLARAKFSASDTEHAALGSYWLSVMGYMDPPEIVALVRGRASGPGGAALAYLASLAIRPRLAALDSQGEREALAMELETALAAVPVDDMSELLAAAVRAAGEAEIAALELDEAGRAPARVLEIARTHGVADPVRDTRHPAEERAAAAEGGEAA